MEKSGMVKVKRLLWVVLLFGYLLAAMSPVLALFWASVKTLLTGDLPELRDLLFSARRFRLLARTFMLAGTVAVAGNAFGLVVALLLWRARSRTIRNLRWLVACFILVPSFVHTQSWIFITDFLRAFSFFTFSGFTATAWVQVFSFLPITILLLLTGLENMAYDTIEAATLDGMHTKGMVRIVFPQIAPYLLVGGGILFILSLSDYAIPSVFQFNVYSLDLFAEFSSTNDIGVTSLLALPYFIVLFVVLSVLAGWMDRLSWHGTGNMGRSANSKAIVRPGLAPDLLAWILLSMLVLLPLLFLFWHSPNFTEFLSIISNASQEIQNTVYVSLLAAGLSVPISFAGAWCLTRATRTTGIVGMLLMLPAVIPASLVGIGAVTIWNLPIFNSISGSLLPTAMTTAARFSFFGVLALSAGVRSLDPALRDVRILYGKRRLYAWCKGELPLLWPSVLAGFVIVFGLTAGELGATLIVSPAGMATLPMKIYNYLHYGATETVAALCLFSLLGALLCGGLAILLLTVPYSPGKRR